MERSHSLDECWIDQVLRFTIWIWILESRVWTPDKKRSPEPDIYKSLHNVSKKLHKIYTKFAQSLQKFTQKVQRGIEFRTWKQSSCFPFSPLWILASACTGTVGQNNPENKKLRKNSKIPTTLPCWHDEGHLKATGEKNKSNPVRKVGFQGGDRPPQGGKVHVCKLDQGLQIVSLLTSRDWFLSDPGKPGVR